MASSNPIKIIAPLSLATLVEPYHTCTFEDGLESGGVFPQRTIESFQMFMERVKPKMKAQLDNAVLDPSYVFENLCYPLDHQFTINGDGLLSVCMKVHDKRGRHKISTYDHVTKELKNLGYIPRHKFEQDVDNAVICLQDPAYIEGVLGSLTDDCHFMVILSHSKDLRILSIFDLVNCTCLLEKNCSQVEFLNCCPTGISIYRDGIARGQFKIAVLNLEMEVRLWDVTTLAEHAIKLEGVQPSFNMGRFVINPRENAVKFSPDGRFLCVLAYIGDERGCACIVMDSLELEPFCIMQYPYMYRDMCSIFPAFSKCGSKFTMFACSNVSGIYNAEDYKLLFFEIPLRVQRLKDLCRSSILKLVNYPKLCKLPLSDNLIAFLQDSCIVANSSHNDEKRCNLM